MIGMIALAGIIVRNSILLVDFINLQVREGVPFNEAIVHSAITRAQPIMLTGLAAMLGAFFILDDPIFNGLAISLIFGIFVSTLLTLSLIHIFSIGILVDDAIVVVENIHRHQQLFPEKTLTQIIPGAVDEVGGPTILATLTVLSLIHI